MSPRAILASCVLAAGCGAAGASGVITLDSLTDVCGGSAELTGQQVVSLLQPMYSATYMEPGRTTEASIALTMVYDGGEILCDPPTSTSGPQLWVTVDLGLTTSDGWFADESLAASISKVEVEGWILAFHARKPVADLNGAFRTFEQGQWKTLDVSFVGHLFLPDPANGVATTDGMIDVEESNGPDDSYQERIASWP